MEPVINPYIAGRPLKGKESDKFFGRKDVLDWLQQELRTLGTNSVLLHGQRRIGKTSTLLQIQQHLKSGTEFIPIYYDLQLAAGAALPELMYGLALAICRATGGSQPAAEKFADDGHYFITEFIPHCYQRLGADKRLVFLLDEFEVIDNSANGQSRDSIAFFYRSVTEDAQSVFVFAIGRNAADLMTLHSTFKTAHTKELWVLESEEAIALIRQAEQNQTLSFTDAAIDKLLSLTGRHPYFLQFVCQRLWETIHSKDPQDIVIKPETVEACIPDVFEAGKQAFDWIWNGLTPLEKVYASALAEVSEDTGAIPESRLMTVLTRYAQRLDLGTSHQVLAELVNRRVLENIAPKEYTVSIEIFRLWIKQKRPLCEIKKELDNVEPLAKVQYEIGKAFRDLGNYAKAEVSFRDALAANPRHFYARIELGRALLEQDKLDEGLAILWEAYHLDPDETKSFLLEGLLKKAKIAEEHKSIDKAIESYKNILSIFPDDKLVIEKYHALSGCLGDKYLKKGKIKKAKKYYSVLNLIDKCGRISKITEYFVDERRFERAKPLYIILLQLECDIPGLRSKFEKLKQMLLLQRLKKAVISVSLFAVIMTGVVVFYTYDLHQLRQTVTKQKAQLADEKIARKEAELKAAGTISDRLTKELEQLKQQLNAATEARFKADALLTAQADRIQELDLQLKDYPELQQKLAHKEKQLSEENEDKVKAETLLASQIDRLQTLELQLKYYPNLERDLALKEKELTIALDNKAKADALLANQTDRLQALELQLKDYSNLKRTLARKEKELTIAFDDKAKADALLAAQTDQLQTLEFKVIDYFDLQQILEDTEAQLLREKQAKEDAETTHHKIQQNLTQKLETANSKYSVLEKKLTQLKATVGDTRVASLKAEISRKEALLGEICQCPVLIHKKCNLKESLTQQEQLCANECAKRCP